MRVWRYLQKHLARYVSGPRSTATVRYMFPAVMSSAAVLGLLAVTASSEDSFLFLETPTQAVETGGLYPVAILASAATPINAIEFTVSFDPEKVDVFGVDRGQSVITIWTEDPVVERASVQFRGGTFQRGFLGEHQIATINFRALETGQHTVSLRDVRLVAGDGAGTEVTATAVPASSLSLFTFDDTTSEDEIRVAVSDQLSTDVNADGSVTLQDISAFMGASSNRTTTYDFNGDGRMTFRDFSIILAEYFFR